MLSYIEDESMDDYQKTGFKYRSKTTNDINNAITKMADTITESNIHRGIFIELSYLIKELEIRNEIAPPDVEKILEISKDVILQAAENINEEQEEEMNNKFDEWIEENILIEDKEKN